MIWNGWQIGGDVRDTRESSRGSITQVEALWIRIVPRLQDGLRESCFLVLTPCGRGPHYPVLPIGYSRKEVVWPRRLGWKRPCGSCLVLSWVTCSGGSQLPFWEKTQAVLQEVHVEKSWNFLTTASITQCTDAETKAQKMAHLPKLTAQGSARSRVRKPESMSLTAM